MDKPKYTRVVIGIQAKTDTPKFPGLVSAELDGKRVLDHVIQHAIKAAQYLNAQMDRQHLKVKVALAIPEGDPIKDRFDDVAVVEGPDHDVLGRFWQLANVFEADYVVRISGDCPMLPDYVISKHIKVAWKNGYDYTSNVDENVRIAADGFDCEVFSRRLLEHTHSYAITPEDRTHVTLFMRRWPPEWAKYGHVVEFVDMSGRKLRVETPADLDCMRKEFAIVRKALTQAEKLHGKKSIYRV